MSTQLLIYETAVPVSTQKHKDLSIKKGTDCTFAQHVNAVPLTAVEFAKAALEYPIVFTKSGDTVMPAVILGLQNKENLYLKADGSWDARYIPAFIRRYPFVFSRANEGKTFALCIDESFSGCNRTGMGERLFDSLGERSDYLKNVLNFLQDYQGQFQVTETFGKKLSELDLLEPMQAQITLKTGKQMALTGFMAVNRDRLKGLSAETLAELVKTNQLEFIYIHLQSMGHISTLANRLPGASINKEDTTDPKESAKLESSAEAQESLEHKNKKKSKVAAAE
jgi:hypothetical protein